MQVIQVLQIWVVPLAVYLLGGVGAWLVVRTPAVNPAAIARDAGLQTRRHSRILLWVILAGLMAAPFESIAGLALSWVSLQYHPPGIAPEGFAISLVAFSAGLVLAYLAAWLLFRRIDWAGVASATGWRSTAWQRLLLLLACGLFLTWPVTVPVRVITGVVQFSSVTAGRDLVFARQVQFIMLESVIAYGLGVWAAGRILPQMAGRPERFLREGSRWVDAILFLALAGVLAEGVLQLFGLFNEVFEPILYPYPGFLAGDPARTVLDITLGRLTPSTLQLLAYLPAILVMRGIDWDVVERRSGWTPARLEKGLVFLTVGAWLAWPFDLVGRLISGLLPAVQPGFVVMPRHLLIALAVAVVLYVFFLYSPGSPEENV